MRRDRASRLCAELATAYVKMMDPMANLDMEKKMGFGMKDVDDFLERAKDVEQKINDIKSGKISGATRKGARTGRTGEGRSRGGEGEAFS